MEIDKNLHMGILLDIYGELLTERQYEMMSMYFHDDLSLSEIAEQYDISRQGVHDAIKRGEESLVNYDSVLKLAEMQEKQKEQLLEFKAQALEALDECRKVSFGKNIADSIFKLFKFENTVEN